MKGSFVNKDECIKELHNQGFVFFTRDNNFTYYYSKTKNEIAEINVYSDNSASALIGKYSIKN